ncbi:zinc finger protein 92-like [Anoplophora glabripennis]|uniref:zinc finger protein 92-like n=1 Tax=Anoplophora glabripennis TaxID=217634 RepID=UPI000C765A90|nr:zinc finger protein 92-like [Anoplophora glabripennis]
MEKLQTENLEKMFCRLCINSVDNDSCQVIGEALKDVLEIVLPKLNLDERNKHFICEACSIKLFDAFNFKSSCIETEDIIFPYIDVSKVSVVDLKEVYLREKGNIQLIDISENQRICRLCFQLVTSGFVSLNEVDIGIVGTYIPQVNINATRDPVICGPCFNSLRTHGGFAKNCLDAQEQYKSSDKQFYVKTEEIKVKLEEDSQDVPEKFKNIDEQSDIRSEKIEIKLEGEVCDGDSSSYHLDNELVEGLGEIENEHMLKWETEFKESNFQIPASEKPGFQNCEPSLDKQFYRCDQSIHIDFSGVRTYRCDMCSYETKFMSSLKKHQLIHKDSSEVQTYKCDTCSFKITKQTKHKSYLKVHQLTHKNPAEIQMYRCDMCDHKAKLIFSCFEVLNTVNGGSF